MATVATESQLAAALSGMAATISGKSVWRWLHDEAPGRLPPARGRVRALDWREDQQPLPHSQACHLAAPSGRPPARYIEHQYARGAAPGLPGRDGRSISPFRLAT